MPDRRSFCPISQSHTFYNTSPRRRHNEETEIGTTLGIEKREVCNRLHR